MTTGLQSDGPWSQIPRNWLRARIDEVGDLRLGLQRSPDRTRGDQPTRYVRAANITERGLDLNDLLAMDVSPEELASFALASGDVLLAEASGSRDQVGRSAIYEAQSNDLVFQNTVVRFRSDIVESRFAQIVFRYLQRSGQFAEASRGVGILHLGLGRMRALEIPIPPVREQERICIAVGDRLDRLAEARDLLQRSLQGTLEQDREILALASSGAIIGAAGSDWPSVRVDEAGQVQLGLQRSPANHYGEHIRPYLRVANVLEDRLNLEDVHEMNFPPEVFPRYKLAFGDILLNEGQSPELVGRPAMFRDELEDVAFQKTLLRFRASEEVEPEFALLIFRHYLHSGLFKSVARWSTNIAHLTRVRFAEMPFPIPERAIQRAIVDTARPLLERSKAQRELIQSALARLPAQELETLRLALNGLLVDSDPEEMPPNLRPTGSSPVRRSEPNRRRSNGEPPVTSDRAPAKAKRSLQEVLQEGGRPLPLPELLAQAGYDRDSTEDVEEFYVALRDQIEEGLLADSVDEENASVTLAGRR